jgi:hypothetical protein
MMKKSNLSFDDKLNTTKNDSSTISTPRLTPLKMIERNRNQVVSKDDINRLESKIKDLESQIFTAKVRGEEKKLDKLEESLRQTESYIY